MNLKGTLRSDTGAKESILKGADMSSTEKNAFSGSVVHPHVNFKGIDYDQWRRRIRLMLKARSLEHTIKAQNKGSDFEQVKALELIVNHLDNTILRLCKEEESPFLLLQELDKKYGESDSAAIVTLR